MHGQKTSNSVDVFHNSRIYSQRNSCEPVLILHFKHFDLSASKFPKFGDWLDSTGGLS